ncbi:hypothetical protein LAZ67_1000533, partial [Cordylochernes scorpioides]
MDKLKKACETKRRTLESVIAEEDGELGKQEPSQEMLMSLQPKLLRCKDKFLITSDCLIEQLTKADREDEEIEDVDIVQANLFGRSEGVLQKMEQLLAKPTIDRESIVSGGNEGKSNLHRLPKLELPKFGGEALRLSSQLRALGSLGVTTDKCAAILYPMVESALPEDLFVAWERTRHHHKPDEDGTHKSSEGLLEKLMEFLKHEVEGSERMRLARQPISSSYPSQFNRDKPPKPKTSVATAASLLKRERTPLRNTITRTTNEIKSGLSLEEVDIILIRAKFERLTILNDRLILIDDKIKEILLDDPRSTEAQINDEMELCETYSLQVGIVAQKVKEYESKLAAPWDDKMLQSSTSDVKRHIKLPKFELKKHTGELEEWLSWWSHFEKIHLDESLSDVDKFEYLIQSMVVGSKAYRLVTSFPLTQKNYNKVIGDLKDRFGDRDMLTELYVRKLLKLVIASARSEKRTLAQLYDDLVAHLHSLGSLGVDSQSGGGAFLYPLVESSLPLELIKIWLRSRTPFKERDYSEIEAGIEPSGAKAFDKLEGLIEFLKQEVKNAERISFVVEGFEPSLPLKQGKRENNPPKIHTASALFVGKTNLPCLFCDKDNHLSQNCFKAAKMLESDRLKRVQDAKVCFKCLRKNHLKKDCRSFVRCKRCQEPHFEIMCRGTSHSQENLNWRSDNRSHNSLAEQNERNSEPVTAMANQVCTNNISLMTLIVKIKGPKRSKMVRVLLDSGSQKSYIRRSLAKELDLPQVGEVKLNKFLFGGQTTGEKAHSIFYFQLDNVDEGKAFKMEALEETIICGNISPVETGPRQWELDKKGITLTKGDNNKTEIDILIGGDYYGQLLTGKIEQLAGGLTAIQTVLGWTLIGNTSSERPETSAQMVITLLTTQQRVASLWELETIGIRDPTEVISVKEKNVLMQEKFREKICRGHDGRYLVSLPWKEGIGTIPNNLEIAEKVLIRSTQRDSLGKGQISHLKTKVQSDGLMYIETKLLYGQSPEEFRKPVLLPCDHPITEKLIRETHSNNCHAGVHFLLSKLREKFWILKARKTIKRVVRGCIICRRHAERANTLPCAPLPKDRLFMGRPFEVTGVDFMGPLYLKNGQKIWITLFTCAVYRAVHLELVEGLDATNFIMALERFIHRRGRPVKIYSDNGTNFKRTNRLFTNLNWDKIARSFAKKMEPGKVTRRKILSAAHSLFNPIGFTCPFTIIPKMLLQESYGVKAGWDTDLSEDISRRFNAWLSQLTEVDKLKIPRCAVQTQDRRTWTLHIFMDSSNAAFVACVYLRNGFPGSVQVQLPMARSRVAPMKNTTIPRLELVACEIGSRLAVHIKSMMEFEDIPITLWTDSTTALAWIKRDMNWSVFVAGRVKKIRQNSSITDWRHVPGKENPADIPSRGASISQLITTRWCEGPVWLKKEEQFWTQSVEKEAIHLELCTSLTTETFIGAMRRFIARRGRPSMIYSDNGLNFVGCKNLFSSLNWNKIVEYGAINRISWKFNPPTACWWGGFWERMIGIVKQLLRSVLGSARVTNEELQTLLCDVEAVVNNRPLMYVSEEDDELAPLTPNKLINNCGSSILPEADEVERDSMVTRYRNMQACRDELRARFTKEYLAMLVHHRKAKKSRRIEVGEIVHIGNDQRKRILWPLGKVEEVLPGADGQ